jgi:hypothetical protein
MHQKSALIFCKNYKKNNWGPEFDELAIGLSLSPTAWGSVKWCIAI